MDKWNILSYVAIQIIGSSIGLFGLLVKGFPVTRYSPENYKLAHSSATDKCKNLHLIVFPSIYLNLLIKNQVEFHLVTLSLRTLNLWIQSKKFANISKYQPFIVLLCFHSRFWVELIWAIWLVLKLKLYYWWSRKDDVVKWSLF